MPRLRTPTISESWSGRSRDSTRASGPGSRKRETTGVSGDVSSLSVGTLRGGPSLVGRETLRGPGPVDTTFHPYVGRVPSPGLKDGWVPPRVLPVPWTEDPTKGGEGRGPVLPPFPDPTDTGTVSDSSSHLRRGTSCDPVTRMVYLCVVEGKLGKIKGPSFFSLGRHSSPSKTQRVCPFVRDRCVSATPVLLRVRQVCTDDGESRRVCRSEGTLPSNRTTRTPTRSEVVTEGRDDGG